jgi:DNA-binding PadR family transcriptional regulator
MNGRLRDGSAAHILAMYRFDTSIWYTCLQVLANRDKADPDRAAAVATGGAGMSGQRSGVLELAVLGLLHENPMHGYELRKRLNAVLGAFRAFGYGSLYPCLKQLLVQGLIAEEPPPGTAKPVGRRSKIVYRLTADGKERLQELLTESGPAAWEDDGFGVHFAFFGQTSADIRLRILEGRRTRLEERLDGFRAALARTRERLDSYTLELHRHGLESVEREVRWLNELIASEREADTVPTNTVPAKNTVPVNDTDNGPSAGTAS